MKSIETLLLVNEAIATISDTEELFCTLHSRLREIFRFEVSGIVLLDLDKSIGTILWMYTDEGKTGLAGRSLHAPLELLKSPPFSYDLKNPQIRRFSVNADRVPEQFDEFRVLRDKYQLKESIHIPMMYRGNLLGFLVLGCAEMSSIADADLPLLGHLGNLIAGAVENVRTYEVLRSQNLFRQFQVEFTHEMLRVINDPDIFLYMARALNRLIDFDFFNIIVVSGRLEADIEASFLKMPDGDFRFLRLPDGIPINQQARHAMKGNFADPVVRLDRQGLMNYAGPEIFRYEPAGLAIQQAIYTILKSEEELDIVLFLASARFDAFSEDEIIQLNNLLPQLRLILENYFAFREIETLKVRLESEKSTLLKDVGGSTGKDTFIAESPRMMQVMLKVRQVAPTDTTVLIEGETGVGKELVARAIHQYSQRAQGPLIMVNCAALPAQLIESELFGHEKGSFTGATERRIGKFELAHGGTLFLDEIGELPLELQAKLLRALQEKEIERIGGRSGIKVDVRIIAATNRDLRSESEAGRFRSDLFFRLNVFPIHIPPLRERKEDILPLARFFIEKYGRQMGRPILRISETDTQKLLSYQWPGNVRELEHTIQRAVIVSAGSVLDLADFRPAPQWLDTHTSRVFIKTLEEVEKEHIIEALRITGGRVSGERGAARLLGINPKTLDSRMRKLGIRKEIVYRSES
ncbi:MAG: sigma 54-interacting transcriptional regulator [Bacteroidales bacterium]